MNSFPEINIDRLRDRARNWIKDFHRDLGIGIERITLYRYRASIPMVAFLGLNLGDGEADSQLKYAVILTITCPGEAPESNEHAMCPHSSIESFVSRYTSHEAGIPTFALDSIKEAYKADAPANYLEQWTFLPDCVGPGCKGTALPTEVKTDESSVLLFDEDKSFSLLIKSCENESTGENEASLELPTSQNPNTLFPELNIKKIREIGERCATQFQKQGGFFNQIILCRYSANRFYEYQAPKYAVVLDVRHYEKPDYIDGPRHLELFVGELANSPYCSLACLTNYAAWAKNDPKGSRTQLKKHFPWNYLFFNEEYQREEVDYQKKFIGQTGFETPSDFVSAGIPYYFEEDYFTDVYVDRAPDNWRHQWLFIPFFKGCELPNQIQVTDVAIIYPNGNWNENGEPDTVIPRAVGGNETSHSLIADFQRVMDECYADIGVFWDRLKRKARNRHGSIDSVDPKALYDLAKEVYQEHETYFQELEIKDIDKKDFYATNTDRKRAIIGNVLLQVIARKCPQALTSTEIDTSIQSLHNLFRSKQPFKKSKSR
jgi:hypothetical protein